MSSSFFISVWSPGLQQDILPHPARGAADAMASKALMKKAHLRGLFLQVEQR
ncbi:hypothetical protein [Comamonas terrigena]|uniref:hypothetical protein n=1 Tax=Comamonas terrigena TaxID=32013 RepID=UPI002446C02D|nr:hypothetical protein [Comamonas terrigena]MDH1700352.1 hypothetical protein [Comamonas terrigena]